MSNAYYQDELRYLREVGPEFARSNPEIARFLGDRGSDPDVERLLEGVAFLCGRIRQKLDDELPEITANMMSLLWPHYLRPIPSMSILELLPELEAMQAPFVVEKGTVFASTPVDGTQCRYRSAWPLTLRPWAVDGVKLDTSAAKPVELTIRFKTSVKAELEQLELGKVSLHLTGDPAAAFTLYLLLGAHVDYLTISDGSSNPNRKELQLGPEHLRIAGLSSDEGVLPYPARSFAGYRLLQEYFAFKERFLFVEASGLDRAATELELTDTLEMKVTFNRRLETYPLIAKENIRLHCVPILNLFEQPAEPVRIRHDRTEYLMQPSKAGSADRRHLEIYSVDAVAGLVHGETLETREYQPFYSFRHSTSKEGEAACYFQTHVRPNVTGGDLRLGTDTYMSFVAESQDGSLPGEETISVELTCTNRDLPLALRAGDICEPTDTSPPGTRFRNIVKPTATISPPLGKSLHWRLISHMSLNYVSLIDAENLRELLKVYDFQSEHDAQRHIAHQRLLDGILNVESSFGERLIRGSIARGTILNIELNEDHFAGEGDAYLFSSILDRFIALYSTINAFTQLTVRFARSGQVYEFPPRWGEQCSPAQSRTGS